MKKFEINNGNGEVHMVRYSIFSWLKLHHFLKSDQDCMHDHPWKFISIILRGYYYEETPRDCKKYKSGSILVRKAKHIHRILVPQNKSVWSLVITFKPTQTWGFYTKKGWIHWRKYIETFKGKSPC